MKSHSARSMVLLFVSSVSVPIIEFMMPFKRSILDNDLMQVTAIKKVFEKYDACTFITTITIQRIMHCTLTLTLSISTHSEVASDFLILGLLGLRYWR